jgi:hypothetical protein
MEVSMSRDDFPIPQTGLAVTHFLVVSDQDRSSDLNRSVFGATVVLERDRVILSLPSASKAGQPVGTRTSVLRYGPAAVSGTLPGGHVLLKPQKSPKARLTHR